jgi:septin family protein
MNSTSHYQNIKREQMSISSITSNQQQAYHPAPPSFSKGILDPYHHYQSYSSSKAEPRAYYLAAIAQHSFFSPPKTPEQLQRDHFSPPSSPHSSIGYSSATSPSYYQRAAAAEETADQYGPTSTLQERRQRNKAASAKYRQKKNIQQHEMRNMINQISERNALLERQLREVREENQKLRATADRLRGKFVAKKMLRQWMDRHQLDLLNEEDDDLASLCSDI